MNEIAFSNTIRAYIYGVKGTAKETPLIRSLREELFVDPTWDKTKWSSCRNTTNPIDVYQKPSWVWGILESNFSFSID